MFNQLAVVPSDGGRCEGFQSRLWTPEDVKLDVHFALVTFNQLKDCLWIAHGSHEPNW
jgi:hypothetical protein